MASETQSALPADRAPRIAVVTAVAAGKDLLVDPEVDVGSADFIAYSDRPQDHLRVWQVRPLPIWSSDPRFAGRRHAKLPKVLPQVLLPGYDFYIWIDGNYTLKASPEAICEQVLKDSTADIAVFKHRLRDCVFREAGEVLKYQLDHADRVQRQMAEYRRQGFQRRSGLFELPAFAMRASPQMLRLSLAWWEQICRFSSRDQLSFPYAVFKTGARVAVIDAPSVHDNPYLARLSQHCYPCAVVPMRRRVMLAARRTVKRLIAWR